MVALVMSDIMARMRIPNQVHQAQPWVVGRIAPDFRLMDVWELPVEGDRDDFGRFLDAMASFDPTESGSVLSRFLFWFRLRLGALLGWDKEELRTIPGSNDTSLADRLPDQGPVVPETTGAMNEKAGGFTAFLCTDDEWAAEISNSTVHGVLQLTWVEHEAGRYRAHLAVYVKERGRLGQAYLRLIGPFRHLVVYPSLMRAVGRQWAPAQRSTP
jgi:hypothetical protein